MELVLIRGLPGSGKSTLARRMKGYAHYEADMFFERDGAYLYDRSKIADAHKWCQRKTKAALKDGKSVVVANTFTRKIEVNPYIAIAESMGIPVRIVEATGNWPNVHGVPDEIVKRMRERWEEISY